MQRTYFFLLINIAWVICHGLPDHHDEHRNGIQLKLYSLSPSDQLGSNISIDSKFAFNLYDLQNHNINERHPLFETLLDYNAGNTSLHGTNLTRVMRFGPPGKTPTGLILQMEYIQLKLSELSSDTNSLGQAVLGGFLGVTITNLCSLLGVVCIPIKKTGIYPYLLTFMVALAVAALSSTALLVLIPEALQMHSHSHDVHLLEPSSIKFVVVFIGIIVFYSLEYFLLKCAYACQKTDESEQFKVVCMDDGNTNATPVSKISTDLKSVMVVPDQTANKKCNITLNCSRERLSKILPVAWMILIGDAVHNLMDGLTIGAGFSRSTSVGIMISLSIFLEELPHELGDFAILLTSGFSVRSALMGNFLSSCSAYLGLLIGLMIGEIPSGAAFVFAITAGFFLYISLSDMLPEMRNDIKLSETEKKSSIKIFAIQMAGLTVGFLCILIVLMSEKWIAG